MRVEISGVGGTQFPIAIADFSGDTAAGSNNSSLISEVIRADLLRSGVFKLIDTPDQGLSETASITYSHWKTRGADYLTVGSIQRLADGNFDIRYRLYDTIKQTQIDSIAYPQTTDLRLSAHRLADRIYEKITGERGIFATRIAYVVKKGNLFELQIADSDGQNAQPALRSREPIISPTWSPDSTRLAYVSFESRKPVIYVHTLSTGQRIAVANFKGNNSAPAWSPDGRQMAVVLTRDGLSQIYLMNADGSNVRRLIQSSGIDTEPVFSADGQTLYFTSDRSGGPQIYKVPVAGGEIQRVTFKGDYNISPAISPDGTMLAYVTRRAGKFQIASLELGPNARETILTEGERDEAPSFAPNGKLILYATQQKGRSVLAAVSSDGRFKQILSIVNGEVREPTWGSYIK